MTSKINVLYAQQAATEVIIPQHLFIFGKALVLPSSSLLSNRLRPSPHRLGLRSRPGLPGKPRNPSPCPRPPPRRGQRAPERVPGRVPERERPEATGIRGRALRPSAQEDRELPAAAPGPPRAPPRPPGPRRAPPGALTAGPAAARRGGRSPGRGCSGRGPARPRPRRPRRPGSGGASPGATPASAPRGLRAFGPPPAARPRAHLPRAARSRPHAPGWRPPLPPRARSRPPAAARTAGRAQTTREPLARSLARTHARTRGPRAPRPRPPPPAVGAPPRRLLAAASPPPRVPAAGPSGTRFTSEARGAAARILPCLGRGDAWRRGGPEGTRLFQAARSCEVEKQPREVLQSQKGAPLAQSHVKTVAHSGRLAAGLRTAWLQHHHVGSWKNSSGSTQVLNSQVDSAKEPRQEGKNLPPLQMATTKDKLHWLDFACCEAAAAEILGSLTGPAQGVFVFRDSWTGLLTNMAF
ncbi:translation initiation factor IF-2-like [Vulpes lagopus]|uniref:translation initiation factor IF-2-like n=1 Tax=Vulpes lagopus TaxID=494514 RepID=UPI001BCA2113|nr:translation initiation factor IF-2-like [Vulpes lagopus]